MFKYDDLIGVPFADGGRDKKGLDCYGLASLLYARQGVLLPDFKVCAYNSELVDDTIGEQRKYWQRIDNAGQLPIPCLVVIRFNHPVLCNHVGVYIGDGRFIHTREKIGVNIDRIDSPAWRRKIEGFYIPIAEAL